MNTGGFRYGITGAASFSVAAVLRAMGSRDIVGSIGGVMQQEEKQEKKNWMHAWWTRALAGFLAVAMAATALLANAARVEIPKTGGSASEYTLSESTDFVNKNIAARMEDMLAQLFVTPTTLEQHYRSASILIGSAKYDEALKEIDACLSLADAGDTALNDELWLKRGCLETLMGQYDAALVSFSYISPGAYADEQLLIHAQIYSEQGDMQKTTDALEGYVDLHPEDLESRSMLANAYIQLERYDDAIGQYEAILQADGDEAGQTYMLLASAQMLAGRYEDAVESFLSAEEAGYSDPSACYAQSALASYLVGDFERVISYGEQAVSIGSENFTYESLYYYMALAKMNLGVYEDAVVLFTDAIDLKLDIDDAYYYRGACFMAVGDMQAAIADFTTVIDRNVEALLPNCYFNRGICAADQKDYELAKSDFEAVLRLAPEGELRDSAQQMLDLL